MKIQGKIILLSAPSRGGKNAVIAELLKNRRLKLNQVITYTTRKRRGFEINHVHYHFVTRPKFRELIKKEAFLEWVEFNKNLYGTPAKAVHQLIRKGENVLLIIEIHGAKELMAKFPGQTLSIFLKPPLLATLRKRFQGDPHFTPAMIADRLATAKKEIAASKIYDYVVVNEQGKFKKTVRAVKEIILKSNRG